MCDQLNESNGKCCGECDRQKVECKLCDAEITDKNTVATCSICETIGCKKCVTYDSKLNADYCGDDCKMYERAAIEFKRECGAMCLVCDKWITEDNPTIECKSCGLIGCKACMEHDSNCKFNN